MVLIIVVWRMVLIIIVWRMVLIIKNKSIKSVYFAFSFDANSFISLHFYNFGQTQFRRKLHCWRLGIGFYFLIFSQSLNPLFFLNCIMFRFDQFPHIFLNLIFFFKIGNLWIFYRCFMFPLWIITFLFSDWVGGFHFVF